MAKTNSTSLFSYSGLHSAAMKALISVVSLLLVGCGGIIAPKPISNLPVPTPTPVAQSAEIKYFTNVAETWTFQSQCQNTLADGSLGPAVTANSWIDINPVDSKHSVWHYRKDQPCAYWLPGTDSAELWFNLELATHWYSTGGIMNAPFGNTGNGNQPVLNVAYPVNTKPGNARPYMILPAFGGFSYQTLFDDTYPIGGTALRTDINASWSTSSIVQNVSTPFYTGSALIVTVKEESIIEVYTFAPNLGLIQVSCPDEGAGSPCPTMIRTS